MKDLLYILKYLKPHKLEVGLSLLCHFLMAIFTIISIPLIIPFFQLLFSTVPEVAVKPESTLDAIGWLEYFFVELIQSKGSQYTLMVTCLFIVASFFFKNLFRYLGLYLMIPVRSTIITSLRDQLYNSYLFYEEAQRVGLKRGDMISKITADVQEVEFSILRFVQAIFKSPIIIIGSVILMFSIHVKLTFFVFVLMIFTVLVIGSVSKSLKKNSGLLQNTLGQISSIVDETLDGHLLMKVYRVTGVWKNKFKLLNSKYKEIYNTVLRRQELSSPLSEFLGVSVVVVLLWYGAQQVFEEALKPEAFFAFIFAFYHVIEPLKSFSTAYYNIKKGVASLNRVEASLINVEGDQELADEMFRFEHSLKFEAVGFNYGSTSVLRDLSFEIRKGEKIAFVGESGAGKSTILSLLLKIIKPSSGSIFVDGVNLKTINADSLYANVGLVTQNSFIYNDTISENILMGRELKDEESLSASISLAGIQSLLQERKSAFEEVGDRGQQLSGGEKQRISIARALLDDPPLILMDEPTSALDAQAEQRISHAIVKAISNRTAIIIAHRISTVKDADKIFFLKDGKIHEKGSHKELVALKGSYFSYCKLQNAL